MRIGDVVAWETDRTLNGIRQPKMHVYVGDTVGRQQIFLYVCGEARPHDFVLRRVQYNSFLRRDSGISCSSPEYYTIGDLETYDIETVGRLSSETLRALYDHLDDHDVMEAQHTNQIRQNLLAVLK
jgi:hypothetical protein